jgi:hypothetical protein
LSSENLLVRRGRLAGAAPKSANQLPQVAEIGAYHSLTVVARKRYTEPLANGDGHAVRAAERPHLQYDRNSSPRGRTIRYLDIDLKQTGHRPGGRAGIDDVGLHATDENANGRVRRGQVLVVERQGAVRNAGLVCPAPVA